MSNAASTILKFFEAEKNEERSQFTFRALIEALGEIEDNIDIWEQNEIIVSDFKSTMSRVATDLTSNFRHDLSAPVHRSSQPPQEMHESDFGMLRWIEEKLSNTAARFDPETLPKIAELISQARKLIADDDSLNDELKLFMVRVINQIQEAIDEYSITGDFRLTEAYVRLIGAVSIAEAQSSQKEKWESFRKEYLIPVAVGFTLMAPSAALNFANLLAIGS